MGATKCLDVPPKISGIERAIVSREGMGGVVTVLTVTVAPALTVVTRPNAKFLIVIMSLDARAFVVCAAVRQASETVEIRRTELLRGGLRLG
jgi:hypothetical protein